MSGLEPQNDSADQFKQLIHAAKNGDKRALGILFNHYEKSLKDMATRQLSKPLAVKSSASDLVQDTFSEATRDISNFKGTEEDQFIYWLTAIYRNRRNTSVRKHVHAEKRSIRREVSTSQVQSDYESLFHQFAHTLTPSQPLLKKEKINLFLEGLNSIRKDYREVIYLKHFEQIPFSEIATKFEKSEAAVTKMWQRAIEQLRSEIVKLEPNFHERL